MIAYNIWNYAIEHEMRGVEAPVDEQGAVLFDDLPVGLYLLCQTDNQAADGYLPMNPFLISVPFMTDDGYTYHVVADPKCNIDTGTTPPPSPPPSPPPGIPDTGQDNWPVPVLAISGLLIFAFGWVMRFNGRNRKDET